MATSAWPCPPSDPQNARVHRRPRAFTLLELLATIAIIALLLALMLPTLAGARSAAHTTRCLANQRQLAAAWTLYAGDHAGRAMPLAYWSSADVGDGAPIYWWGRPDASHDRIDHRAGFIAPYLDATPARRSAFECPAQPWGSYEPQTDIDAPASTYGYNGYYLSPSKTPGWAFSIGHRPWRRLFEIRRPTELVVFADALLGVSDPPRSTALLDPPMLFDGSDWYDNPYPTTAFRHAGACVSARADASARTTPARPAWLTQPELAIGSIGTTNAPHYVPDWDQWP